MLAAGGSLDPADIPGANVEVAGDQLVVWGLTEVPDGSRLQAAYAMVDAVTRAELLKFLRIHVASQQNDISRAKGQIESQKIELRVAEAVTAALPRAETVEHGWARIHNEKEVVLRIVGRLRVSRALLEETLTSAFDADFSRAMVTRFFGAEMREK